MKTFIHELYIMDSDINVSDTPNGRHYCTPDGKKFPSVTTVIGWEKREFFAQWRRDNPEEARRVLRRGTRVHAIVEGYIRNENPNRALFESRGTDEAELFTNMQKDIDRIDNIRAIEVPLWSSIVGMAGRTDCIAEFDGSLSVVDFKTSTNPKSEDSISDYFMQGAAYSLMWQDRTKQPIKDITIIMGVENTGECQVFTAKTKDWVEPLFVAVKKWRSRFQTT